MVQIHPGPPLQAARGEVLVGRMVDGLPGAVAQLGERGLCKPEVVGSIPISSTIFLAA